MEAIILAGGLGTRLRSRVADRPKAMVPIAGRPFVELLFDRLIDAHCTRLILSVGYMHQIIIDAFGREYRGVPIDYVIEENPLGTGGAIRMALEKAQEPLSLVLNGDTFLDADFTALLSTHVASKRPLTMSVVKVEDMARYGGVVLQRGHVVGFIEKQHKEAGWINAGAYVMDHDFPWPVGLPSKFSFEIDVITPSLSVLCPTAFLCNGFFLDIGVPEDLDRAQVKLSQTPNF